MTRKQGQSSMEIYDLSTSRNIAAFEALIDADDDLEDPQQLPPRGKRGQQQQKREKEKFFKLKANLSPAEGFAATAVPERQQLQQLLEMFQNSCEAGIITDVYKATGNNFDAAVDALLSMLGAPQLEMISADQPSSSSAAEHAASTSSSSSSAQAGGSLPWRDLANDVKMAILSHLPLKDLARLAHTSKEFHERASTMRRQVQHLVIQPGLGYSAIEGMVRSHGAAAVVDLSKLEKHISRQDPEQLAPQVVAMHKQEAEANLWKAVLAVSAGDSASGSREQPVKGLVLKGLVGATDRVLAEALNDLKGVRSLDLSHCPLLTNKSLYALAKYKASEGVMQQQQQRDTTTNAPADAPAAEALSDDYGFGSSEEWEQCLQSEDGVDSSVDVHDAADADGVDAAPDDDEDCHVDSSSSSQAQDGDGIAAAVAEDAVADADSIAAQSAAPAAPGPAVASAADNNSDIAVLSTTNPAIRDAVTTALTTAVTNRLAAVKLQAQQQAAAAAASAAAAAANPVGLQELRLAGNSGWADDGLRQLLQGPVTKHSLVKLDISGCKGITAAGLIIPPLGVLRNLKACRLQGLTQLVVHMPASHPLSTLDLSNCHYLRKVDLHLKHLQQLNLAGCRTLYRLRMRCPTLRSLSLSQCGMLHEFHTDAWQVPALQNLNMFGCRRALGQMLQAVLDELLELQRIDLNGCWGVSRLHLLGNPHLESIDLTGCRNLMSFSSSSTALTELEAASCSRLYSLTLASSNLITLQLQNCAQLAEVYVPASAGSSSSANRHSKSSRGKSATGKGLSVNGCSALSADAKVRLAMSVSAP